MCKERCRGVNDKEYIIKAKRYFELKNRTYMGSEYLEINGTMEEKIELYNLESELINESTK